MCIYAGEEVFSAVTLTPSEASTPGDQTVHLFLILEVCLLFFKACRASLPRRGPGSSHVSSKESLKRSFHGHDVLVWLFSPDLVSQANVGIQCLIIDIGVDGAEGGLQVICLHLSVQKQLGHCYAVYVTGTFMCLCRSENLCCWKCRAELYFGIVTSASASVPLLFKRTCNKDC